MKRYQLYGLGNALVDTIAQVDEAFLSMHGLDKGHMELVNSQEQRALITALGKRSLTRQSGGSAANTVASFSQFGGSSAYACLVGQDSWGDFYLQDLSQAGVDTEATLAQAAGDTGTCLVLLTPDGERTMCTNLGISTSFGMEAISTQALEGADCVYIEGYLLASESGAQAAYQVQRIAQNQGISVALTLSDTSMIQHARAPMDRLIQNQVDVLFCNQEEALLYTEVDSVAAAAALLGKQAACVAITQGADGALVHQAPRKDQPAYNYQVPAPLVSVQDTNGAGDMFAAAFLYAQASKIPLQQAAAFACQAASALTQHLGARLPAKHCRTLAQNLHS